MAIHRAKTEIPHYPYVLEHICRYQINRIISESDTSPVHRDITQGYSGRSENRGSVPEVRVAIGSRLTRDVFYSPPPQKEIVPQMNAHVGWLNSGAAHKMHPDAHPHVTDQLYTYSKKIVSTRTLIQKKVGGATKVTCWGVYSWAPCRGYPSGTHGRGPPKGISAGV